LITQQNQTMEFDGISRFPNNNFYLIAFPLVRWHFENNPLHRPRVELALPAEESVAERPERRRVQTSLTLTQKLFALKSESIIIQLKSGFCKKRYSCENEYTAVTVSIIRTFRTFRLNKFKATLLCCKNANTRCHFSMFLYFRKKAFDYLMRPFEWY